MKKVLILITLVFIICGCTPTSYEKYERHTVPPYFVMLTDWNVYQTTRCAGVAVNEDYVITAAHCFQNNLMVSRILTQYNQEFGFTNYTLYPELDLAVIKTSQKIYSEEYAKFTEPTYKIGKAYGICSLYFYNNSRSLFFVGNIAANRFYKKVVEFDKVKDFTKFSGWLTQDSNQVICLGDSGGIVVQDEKVVGMISKILSMPLVGMSTQMLSLDGSAIENKLKEIGAIK